MMPSLRLPSWLEKSEVGFSVVVGTWLGTRWWQGSHWAEDVKTNFQESQAEGEAQGSIEI